MGHHFTLDFVAAPSTQQYATPGWLTDTLRFYNSSVGDMVTMTLPDRGAGFRLNRDQVQDLVNELQKFLDSTRHTDEEIRSWIRSEIDYLANYTDTLTLGVDTSGRPCISSGRVPFIKKVKEVFDLTLADALTHVKAVEATLKVSVDINWNATF